MAITPFDSPLYRDLFHDGEVGSLFTDSAEVRAMMLVEGALAKVQGELGIIPDLSAAFIARAAREIQIDPAGLAAQTGQNGIPVPALVAAMRSAMEAPEHAQYLHWGATTQDIMDTALALRLRQVLALYEKRLGGLLTQVAELATAHADTPMAGRTWIQHATPTSFGAVAAAWGLPLLDLRAQLAEVRRGCLVISLSGAAGTGAAYGRKAPELAEGLAQELRLGLRDISWHSARHGIAGLAGWATRLAASLGKLGEDVLLMSQSEVDEVRLTGAGSSSTMPQKQNPVAPSLLSALARSVIGDNSVLQGAAIHRQQRDAAAWMTEWICLGRLCMTTGRGLQVAQELLSALYPQPDRMRANLDAGSGLIYAEALQFALADRMPRPDAQAAVKELCQQVAAKGGSLAEAALSKWGDDPDLTTIFTPEAQLGQAPAQARSFAAHVRTALADTAPDA